MPRNKDKPVLMATNVACTIFVLNLLENKIYTLVYSLTFNVKNYVKNHVDYKPCIRWQFQPGEQTSARIRKKNIKKQHWSLHFYFVITQSSNSSCSIFLKKIIFNGSQTGTQAKTRCTRKKVRACFFTYCPLDASTRINFTPD